MTKIDPKITLCKVKFNLGACKGLIKDEIDSLGNTARNFFQFVQTFGIELRLRNFVNIWMIEDRIQNLESATCSVFQMYFYEKLFNSDKNSTIQDDTKLTKRTVEILLNEIFSLDDQANETKIEEYASNTGVKISI